MVAASASANLTSNQTMSIFDSIEALDRKVTELQTRVVSLETHLERERVEHKRACEDLQRLKEWSIQTTGALPWTLSAGRELPRR
jgi:hypothetical protein